MTEPLEFEVGTDYIDRKNRRYRLLYICRRGKRPLVFVELGSEELVSRFLDGQAHSEIETEFDIIDKWRAPRTWDVYIVEHKGERSVVTATFTPPSSGEVIARVTVTEGEGLQ